MRTGTNPTPRLEGLDLGAGKTNYLLGRDRTHWQSNVPQYERLRYRDVYPGVDLIFHSEESRLEYDFIVHPGMNPDSIRISLNGAGALSVGANGDLEASGRAIQEAPVAYQLRGKVRTSVPCEYRLAGRETVAFQIGDYDRTLPLVIDPVLVFSTYLAGPTGGSFNPKIAVDQAGFIYITGFTTSNQFPITAKAFDSAYHGNGDVFIAKLDPTATQLIYSTYLGGSGADRPHALAIDATGNLYVAGETTSSDFPVTVGSAQTKFGGGDVSNSEGDAFAVKLDPTGSRLIYAAYLGGSAGDAAYGIAVDGAGDAYISGQTQSSDFPVTAQAFQSKYGGGSSDAFVTKLNPAGSALVFSSFLGGTGSDSAPAVAVDSGGNAYVAGSSHSPDFPVTTGAFQTAYQLDDPSLGGGDAYVVKLDPSGGRLIYATFLGGHGSDGAFAIAVDQTGSVYVAGVTNSYEFPTTPGAFQPIHPSQGGGLHNPSNGFVVRLNPTGASLLYSTYLGGNGGPSPVYGLGDAALSVAIDQAGHAFVGGSTSSSNFPVVNSIQSICGIYCGPIVSTTGFVAELNPAGSSLLFSTFLGGVRQDSFNRTDTAVSAVAVGPSGTIYVAGTNGAYDFPTTPGAFSTTFPRGSTVSFIAKIDPSAPPQTAAANIVNSASYSAGPVAPGEFVSIFGIGLGQIQGFPVTLTPAGKLTTAIGGTTVTFDGIEAPLLYADANQINVIVPYSVAGTTQMQVTFQGTPSTKLALSVAASAPGIFLQPGIAPNQGLIVNQDGTLNSPSNPAARNSVVVFYAIGAGAMNPTQQDGAITASIPPWPKPVLTPSVTFSNVPATLSYAGAAPGLVAGVLQINATVPDGAPTGAAVPLTLTIGGAAAQVSIAIR